MSIISNRRDNGGSVPPILLAIERAKDRELKKAEDAQPYKDALHDILMLKAQDDIGCVPPATKEQWAKAWASAWELFEP